jgi:hypothetical protein
VRQDQEKRFWLCAKITSNGNGRAEPEEVNLRKRDELGLLPAYLRSQYKNLDHDRRTRLKKRLCAIAEKQFPAMGLAAGRVEAGLELKPEHRQRKIGQDETVSIRIPDELKDLLK